MAVDVCSEISSLATSPRISFSHDLNQTEIHKSDASLLDPNSDFAFCISKSFAQELSSADELFSNGKILPIEIKKVTTTKEIHKFKSSPIFLPPQPTKPAMGNENGNENTKKKRLKEYLSSSFDAEEEEEKPLSRSFWQFRRSSSLNWDSGRSKGLIRSFQFLSRSNSTGSVPNPKQTVLPKENLKQQKQPPLMASTKPQVSNPAAFYSYNASRKTQSRKNCRYYGNGVSISPVLNIPHVYISKGTIYWDVKVVA
ncbi:hypothetical protein F0562_032723 [Nyssa sinensis]|uniref:Uncharacterized protein n=1 Tax=Nyssa sinensis TaxID=561372 RepID=A0A5J5AQ19_9ASTE|nr:hypothetical protein F0562_032723 [Nyssa sinensis]